VPVDGLETALAGAGSHHLVVTATDAAGNSAEKTLDVIVPALPGIEAEPVDTLPVADAGGPYRVTTGTPLRLDGSGSHSVSGGPLEFAWSVEGVGTADGERPEVTWPRPGRYLVTLSVRDGEHWSRSEPGDGSRVEVEVYDPDVAVSADAGPDLTGVEGAPVRLAGEASQGATTVWSAEPVAGGEGTCRIAEPAALVTTVRCDDEGSWRLTLTATSATGRVTASDTAELVVGNAAPTIALDAPDEAVLGEPVTVSAAVTDAGRLDVLACEVTWPDGVVAGAPVRDGACAATRVLSEVGSQQVQVAVTDEDGGRAVATATVAVRYAVVLPDGGTVNAGRAVPILFGLGGYHGLDVLREAVSVRLDDSGEPTGREVPALTPGASDLSYASGTDRYHWNWDTAQEWAGQTRALILRFDDGSEHRVVYRFR
jgi:hypothetical protein